MSERMSDRKQNQPTDSTLMILYTVYTGRKGGNGGKFQILGFKDTLLKSPLCTRKLTNRNAWNVFLAL